MKHPRTLPTAASLAAALLLSACGYDRTVISQPATQLPTEGPQEPGGMVYALPKSLVTIRGELKDGVVTYTPSVSIVSDPTARFRLRHVASGWTDDDLNFTVGTNGLLSSSRATLADRRAEVAVQVARSIGAVGGAVIGRMTVDQRAQPPGRAPSPYPFTTVLEVEELLRGGELPDGARLAVLSALPPPPPQSEPGTCPFSVCYRTVVPVTFAIVPPRGTVERASRFNLAVVDPQRTEGIDLRGAPLVTRTTSVTFENGLLTGTSVVMPSTAVAAARIPYDVIRAGLGAFGEILTLRVNNTNSQAELIAAQTSMLTNTRAQIDAQRQLNEARTQAGGAGPAVIGVGTAP